MNAKKLIAAVAVFAAAGSAMADQTYPYVEFSNTPSVKTRAEVIAEMQGQTPAAKQAKNSEYVEFNQVATGKTRAEVRAELDKAYADGQYADNASQEYVEFTNVASTRTRDEVRREAIQAARDSRIGANSSGS